MDRDQLRDLARRWDGLAEQYVERLYDELDHKPRDRELLARVAKLVGEVGGPLLDVGCGPGHVARALHELGVDVRGVDLSPAMVALARQLNPGIEFAVGDMLELELEPGSLGGAVAFYSMIHLARDDLDLVVTTLADAIRPGGPLLVAVHAGTGLLTAEEVLGEPVTMAVTLFDQDEVAGAMERAGFAVESAETRDPYPEEGKTRRVYVLGTRRSRPTGET